MYCYYCGKKIDEAKLNKAMVSDVDHEIPEGSEHSFVCPRCGHLIHEGASEEDVKSLSRASHAQIQRAKNSLAVGMGSLCIGIIGAIIAILFFFLAKKPSNHYQLVTTCAEFYVSVVLGAISVCLLIFGTVYVVMGGLSHRRYTSLLQDINNQTFVQ